MPVSALTEDDIKQLIRMIPVVNEKTDKTVLPVLEKIINRKQIDTNETKRIETWAVKPAPGGGYSADMCLAYIIKKWFKDQNSLNNSPFSTKIGA